ncbi:hypothetical protein BOC52_19065 [Burkholderia pseudomallei]|nr:hypothetical protein BK015_16725 [Burkholderia pseudomallei]ARK39887.1 hypothetical protein BOC60_06435 [Burkholderia pseudomallei]ARK75690.1 hypothetical protein BOC39_18865 [Burkholderia pseudomallei]ARL08290.1 hypothetical protein BOC45_05120 [Burkholderia pseudomallei]ARL58692.1 hypothetical protein BOC52_19065 [Burkholderia pseudomallei]
MRGRRALFGELAHGSALRGATASRAAVSCIALAAVRANAAFAIRGAGRIMPRRAAPRRSSRPSRRSPAPRVALHVRLARRARARPARFRRAAFCNVPGANSRVFF